MAFKCGFFTSKNGDRKYGVDDMMAFVRGIVSEGVVADDKYSDGLQVQAKSGLDIIVKKGNGLFFNKWCENDSDMVLTVPLPHVTATRIDSVVIRIDISDDVRSGTIEYKQGGSTAPILENSTTVKEYRLANITVSPNVAEITQANIEDTRPSAECGFVTNLLQNSDITATYSQWQAQFNSMQIENQAQFDDWFNNVKETLSTSTLISSFTSRYVTVQQDETTIPIQIPQYKSVLDILQVYINGLICIKDVDYTVDGFNNIILKNGVDKNTEISFIVYKSMDGTGIDKFIEDVDDLITRQDNVESDFTALETRVESAETDITTTSNDLQTTKTNVSNLTTKVNTATTNISNLTTKVSTNTSNISKLDTRIDALEVNNANTALWDGANTLGNGEEIKPSKALSACKNGWLLVFCGYNTSTNLATNTRFNTVFVNKGVHANIPGNRLPLYCNMIANHFESGNVEYVAKSLNVYDDRIEGAVQNTINDLGKSYCLRFVFEF